MREGEVEVGEREGGFEAVAGSVATGMMRVAGDVTTASTTAGVEAVAFEGAEEEVEEDEVVVDESAVTYAPGNRPCFPPISPNHQPDGSSLITLTLSPFLKLMLSSSSPLKSKIATTNEAEEDEVEAAEVEEDEGGAEEGMIST